MTIGTPPSTSAQISQVDVEAHLNLRKGTFAQVKCNSSLIPVRRLPFKLIRTKSSSYSYRLSQQACTDTLASLVGCHIQAIKMRPAMVSPKRVVDRQREVSNKLLLLGRYEDMRTCILAGHER